MRKFVERVFLDHPGSVNETYGEHFAFAARFGATLIGAGSAALVHAFLPCFFERTASTTVKRLHAVIANRGTPVSAASVHVAEDPLAYI